MTEFKPCPFCKGTDIQLIFTDPDVVGCKTCGAAADLDAWQNSRENKRRAKMTEKIYDSKAEAIKAAKAFIDTLSNVFDWQIAKHPTLKNLIGITFRGSRDGRYIKAFAFKPAPKAPKAGTRGHGWYGKELIKLSSPIYAATGRICDGRIEVYTSNKGTMLVENFEAIDQDTDLETAVGRIVDFLDNDTPLAACRNLKCELDCYATDKVLNNLACRAAQIANLLRIARGEG